jgi:hypothetical protein
MITDARTECRARTLGSTSAQSRRSRASQRPG